MIYAKRYISNIHNFPLGVGTINFAEKQFFSQQI